MNTIEQQRPFDKVRLALAFALVVFGLVGFYFLQQPPIVRLLAVLVGIGLAIGVSWTTQPGQKFLQFVRDAKIELQKVVWPTSREALQSTLVVIVFIIIIAITLWIVDKFAGWLFSILLFSFAGA